MEKVNQLIELAIDEFKKEHGQDAKLEEGDEFATVFNDGILIIGLENSQLKVKVLIGEPYKVNSNIDLF